MSYRTTMAQLEAIVARINTNTGSPKESYKLVGDKYVAQIGNYHLSGQYGGWALHRMQNEGGGITDVLRVGHVPKAELARLMFAFLEGLHTGLGMAVAKEIEEKGLA